jgi:predicted DNA-binding transcriptional regulator AlpA
MQTDQSLDPVDDVLMPARQVWERYGVTDVCLWRWLQDSKMKFPEPTRINNRRYWRIADLVAWERARAANRGTQIVT